MRLGPNQVLFSSAKAIRAIHTSPSFTKGDTYEIFIYPGEQYTMLTTPSNEEHTYFRRLVSPAFGVSYLSKLEPLINEVLQSLVKHIDDKFKGEHEITIDIWRICLAIGFDVIGTTAFGSSFQTIENGSHELVSNFSEGLKFMMVKLVVSPILTPLFPMYEKTRVKS